MAGVVGAAGGDVGEVLHRVRYNRRGVAEEGGGGGCDGDGRKRRAAADRSQPLRGRSGVSRGVCAGRRVAVRAAQLELLVLVVRLVWIGLVMGNCAAAAASTAARGGCCCVSCRFRCRCRVVGRVDILYACGVCTSVYR